MHVSIAEAKDRLAELIRAVEQGDQVIITRDDGKPVAHAVQPPPGRRPVRLGGKCSIRWTGGPAA